MTREQTKERVLAVLAGFTGPAQVRYIATKVRPARRDGEAVRLNETREAIDSLKRDGRVRSVPGRGWRLA